MTLQRQGGAVLLMVSLVMATIAALAFGMNRAASVEAGSVRIDYERRAAGYLAEAAIANARWSNQVAGCTSTPVASTALGPGSFGADVPPQKGAAKTIDIVGTGSVGENTVQTLRRTQVKLFKFSEFESVRLTKDARDITIDVLDNDIDEDEETLSLVFGRSHALLYWAMNDIKKDALVLSATLTMTPYGAGGAAGTVAAHRVTTRWNDDATWSRPREEATRWNGGDYISVPAATTATAGAATIAWDLTYLVDGWFTGQLPNYGLLLRLASSAPTKRFYSFDASSSRRPELRVTSVRPC